MAKRKKKAMKAVSLGQLTPEMRLAIGVGQIVLDYVVDKIMPPAARAKAVRTDIGLKELTGELRARLGKLVEKELNRGLRKRPRTARN